MAKRKFSFSYTQIIVLGFAGIIILGAFLLALPISSRAGVWTGFRDAIFTSTSATCVTGLVVFDTFTYWSVFGRSVILLLIQIGGLGFMTIITLFSIFLKRQISLRERRLIMQTAGSIGIGGIVKLIKRIALGTLLFEGAGALLLSLRFCSDMGFWNGLGTAVFTSVSAFCNAGFDLMGGFSGPFSSLTAYVGDPLVSITVMALIVTGGLGFIVWSDITTHRVRFKRFNLHSKIVLTVSAVLILGGAAIFFVSEYNDALAGLNTGDKMLASFFLSITPRTAGFNTVDMKSLSDGGSLLTMLLMFIGGSSGSTAGGIKVTTFAVLICGVLTAAQHKESIVVFKRKLDDSVVKQASAIAVIQFTGIFIATMVLCIIEPFTLKDICLETFSAAGTVGLSTGITPFLRPVSRILIMFLMFAGRVGGLTMALLLAEKRVLVPIERPSEKILIG